MKFHLAQINLAQARGSMDDPVMAEFVAALDEINALAESSPGFVWRLKDETGDATSIRAFDDPRLLVNLTVWESIEPLRNYVYRTVHAKYMARRHLWFERIESMHLALWWIEAGVIPSVAQAKERLDHRRTHGDTPYAFSFATPFPPPETQRG